MSGTERVGVPLIAAITGFSADTYNEAAYEANKDKGLVILAINVQETPEEVREHVAENEPR